MGNDRLYPCCVEIVPYFVMEVLNFPGLPGLFISCLFSGALRSVLGRGVGGGGNGWGAGEQGVRSRGY